MRWFDAYGLHTLGLGLLVGAKGVAAAYCVSIVLRPEERAELVLKIFYLLLLHYIIKATQIKTHCLSWKMHHYQHD